MDKENLERECVVCKSGFYTKLKKQVYCSYDCYKEAAVTRSSAYYSALKKAKLSISKICPACHKQFDTPKRRVKYCSNDCYRNATLEKNRAYSQNLRDAWRLEHPKTFTRECDLCGKEYNYKTKQGRYCPECTPLARKITRGLGPTNIPAVYRDIPTGQTLMAAKSAPAATSKTATCWLCEKEPSKENELCAKCEAEQAV